MILASALNGRAPAAALDAVSSKLSLFVATFAGGHICRGAHLQGTLVLQMCTLRPTPEPPRRSLVGAINMLWQYIDVAIFTQGYRPGHSGLRSTWGLETRVGSTRQRVGRTS